MEGCERSGEGRVRRRTIAPPRDSCHRGGMEPAFDTLAYTRRLKAAGLDGTLAEAHAEALHAAFNEGVATKADMRDIRSDMRDIRSDMRELKSDLANVKDDLANVKDDLANVKDDLANVKDDLANVKGDLANVKGDLANVKGDLADVKVAIAGVETRLERAMNRILLAVVAVGGVIVAAIQLL